MLLVVQCGLAGETKGKLRATGNAVPSVHKAARGSAFTDDLPMVFLKKYSPRDHQKKCGRA